MDFARDQQLARQQALEKVDGAPAVKGVSRLSKNVIKDGDLVVMYERHDSLDHMYVKKGEILQNRFGKFYHDDIIGKPFGSMINSFYDNGYLYVLRPTPELWCNAVRTRTQIINELDSSIIIFQLDIFPGSVVVESGTGSGCMTCALARTVSPNGHVHTFEYNAVRAETARQEFLMLGVSHLVSVTCHDVCGKLDPATAGFPGVAPNSVDAVMLDLPEPWHAVTHAKRVLKAGKSICSYSPCIEQCIRTFEALRREGFHTIRMMEVRQRPFDGRHVEIDQMDLGLSGAGAGVEEGLAVAAGGVVAEDGADSTSVAATDATSEGTANGNKVHPRLQDSGIQPPYKPSKFPPRTTNVARAVSSMKGHTAFLTFAVKSESAADGDFGPTAGGGDDVGDGEGEGGGEGEGEGQVDARDREFEGSRERRGKGR